MTLDHLTPYTLPVQRADWGSLLIAWAPLIPSGSSRWLLSRFGELFLEHADGKIGMLQVSAFRYEVVAKNKKDFEEWLVDPDKMSEWFLAPLVDRLMSAGKTLASDRCYSFITPLGLGGEFSEKNVATLPLQEHFGCWGEVFQQIRNLPEGARITLKPE